LTVVTAAYKCRMTPLHLTKAQSLQWVIKLARQAVCCKLLLEEQKA
jgi:hypothetical protein